MLYQASATVRIGRFVVMTSSNTVAENTSAGGKCIGISQEGGRYAPIPLNTASPVEAAQTGEMLNVHTLREPGDFPRVLVGSGGITIGGECKSSNAGEAIAATTGTYVVAIAMETASAGEYAKVMPVLYQLN